MPDTGDIIRHKITGDRYLVACCHPPIVYPIGWPSTPLRLDDVELVHEATDAERSMHIEALSQSTGNGHRPRCARARLGQTE